MRTKLQRKDVRVPTKAVRAAAIKAKFDDLDDLIDAAGEASYAAAGAIDPNDTIVYLDATSVGMAMTLADAAIPGETMHIILRSIANAGDTVVLTPANLEGSTTITFDAVGERITLIWDVVPATDAWNPRAGETATLA